MTKTTGTVLAVAAVIGALGSAAYISTFFIYTDDPQYVEIVRSPLVITAFALMFLGFATAGIVLPTAAVPSLPAWAVFVTAGSLVSKAAMAFAIGLSTADLARFVTEQQIQEETDTLLNFMMGVPHGVLGLVGFIAIAFAGTRRKLFGWGLGSLFVAAGLTSPLWHVPPSGLVGGVAMVLLASTLGAKEGVRPRAKATLGAERS